MDINTLFLILRVHALKTTNCLCLFKIHHVNILDIAHVHPNQIIVCKPLFFHRNCKLMNPFLINATEPRNKFDDLIVQVLNLYFVSNSCFFHTIFDIIIHDLFSLLHNPIKFLDVEHITVHSPDHDRQFLILID